MNEVRAQEKVGDAEEERCRLCLGGEEDGPLVQLCACRGSAKLVHRHCLEKWRRTSGKDEGGRGVHRPHPIRNVQRDSLKTQDSSVKRNIQIKDSLR